MDRQDAVPAPSSGRLGLDLPAQQNVNVRFAADLEETVPAAWREGIKQLFFRGSRFMDEVVFLHGKSSTLILADLIENFELDKVNAKLHWLVRLAGAVAPDGKAPINFRMTFWGRKKIARRCLQGILAWQPDKIILAHGRGYDHNGGEELKRAFRRLL